MATEVTDWGSAREMNAMETVFWRVESDPRLRSTMVAVEILDTAPEWQRFLDAHEWGTRLVPRFRQRVTELPLGLGTPGWANDPDFDLSYHVKRLALPEGAGFAGLLEEAQRMAMSAFDKDRSPWEATLVEGLPGGKAAYLLKMHHSATDGIGGIQLFDLLHSRKREPSPDKPQREAPQPEEPTLVDIARRQLAADARGLLRAARGGAGAAAQALARPDRAARRAWDYAGSFGRVMGDSGTKGSPLLAARSLSWRFGALDVAFADLRGAGKAVDASLNDAFLAALLGGFRLYHERLGHPVDAIPIAIPISVRREGDSAGGNKFASARLSGPVGIADPVERIAAIQSEVRVAREEPALESMSVLAPAMARLPGPVVAQIAGPVTRGNDLQASNVPGIREDVYIAGAKVERAYPYAPLPGCATMITLLTHGETCCVGVNMDAAAVTDPDLFGECLVAGFDEVLGLGADPGPAVWRT